MLPFQSMHYNLLVSLDIWLFPTFNTILPVFQIVNPLAKNYSINFKKNSEFLMFFWIVSKKQQ